MTLTKMDMIWLAVAVALYPETGPTRTVTRLQIERKVLDLFGESIRISAVMIERHLVSFENRQADKANPKRGGSRNRYLFRTVNGTEPSRGGGFRLYKGIDSKHDGLDKTSPTHPDPCAVPARYEG